MKIVPFIGICVGYFMVLLDTTIVTIAGPAIGHDLGGGVSGFQWVVSAYTLVFASLLLTAGALSDFRAQSFLSLLQVEHDRAQSRGRK